MATAEIDLEVERSCAKCYGTGKDPSAIPASETPCSACEGFGYFPTELGEAVVKMLKRRWKLEEIQR